ncbi:MULTISPECIES: flagellar export chaperone FliS [unclassified Campylobacter]|uniref:flagellar export chaperone FliS n=1 Tax=unclassified Campylobacter TaxID=2593542 RepID=UPI001BDAC157|nr:MULTISPECIES: flagellar export chaperone FliS [unclassified Campylobacter]MBZ7975851.1 flagellar export chaperone FliS [Campylobacter sp. RM12637]MBZ7978904.1 flagellar export chaperone FliS [Campylobacter sp. RM12654]MBZ7980785.1 flagellar export chaperone FliS [Campylobacter sp. RM12642]MBZ7982764.1 flagellar export chaperone FliS [Campylobacter sp. RM12640]MBZ7982909.1 flagellar export chaperone FliS [Campylobacter sp. RM12647]MBZ7990009.1 flagellar export chaperone FliS [Campylobacter 
MVSNAYASYSHNNISIESNEKMIELLYEGILRFCSRAKKAIEKNDIEAKCKNIKKATAIFVELLNYLDFSQGDVSYYLQGLYSHQISTLSKVIIDSDTAKLDEVMKVANGLLEAWREVNQMEL